MSTVVIRFSPRRESASWESMSEISRMLVARRAGFNNAHAQHRIANSSWDKLSDSERTALFRVNWREVVTIRERCAEKNDTQR